MKDNARRNKEEDTKEKERKVCHEAREKGKRLSSARVMMGDETRELTGLRTSRGRHILRGIALGENL